MKTDLKRLVGEFVVIVAGVLVALGVDDLRTARADRQLGAYLLEGLRDDLTQDTLRLRAGIGAAAQVRLAADRVLTHLGDPLWVAPAGVDGSAFPLEDALRTVANIPVFTPTDATYQEMIATGAVRVLPTGALRRGVVQYYAVLVPTLRSRQDRRIIPAVQSYQEAIRSAGLRLTDPQQIDSTVVDRLRGNEFVFGHIRGLAANAGIPSRDYPPLIDWAAELLSVIDTIS